jgi:hypothetical protein
MVCAAVGRALRTLSGRSLFVLYGIGFWLLPESSSSGQSFDHCYQSGVMLLASAISWRT